MNALCSTTVHWNNRTYCQSLWNTFPGSVDYLYVLVTTLKLSSYGCVTSSVTCCSWYGVQMGSCLVMSLQTMITYYILFCLLCCRPLSNMTCDSGGVVLNFRLGQTASLTVIFSSTCFILTVTNLIFLSGHM